jgi:hypothetical protein
MRTRSLNAFARTALLTLSTGMMPAAVVAQKGAAEGPVTATGGAATAEPTAQTPPGPGDAPSTSTGSAASTGGITGPAGGTGTLTADPNTTDSAAGTPPGLSGPSETGGPLAYGIRSSGILTSGATYGFGSAGPADNLANLLGSAMSRNPDISVAEGKVRAAQSELDRTRLDVSRQVVEAFQSVRYSRKAVEIAKAQVAQCKEQQAYMKQMHKEGAAAASDVATADVAAREAELALIKSEAQLESTIATLDYLAGGSAMPGGGMMSGMGGMGGYPGAMMPTGPGASGTPPMGSNPRGAGETGTGGGATDAGTSAAGGLGAGTTASPEDGGASGAGTAAVFGGSGFGDAGGGARVIWSTKARGSTFHERLRSKLEEPTTLDFPEVPLSELMDYIDDVHGITNIIIDTTAADGRDLPSTTIRLKLDKVPLSAALKAIEDLANVHFVVTDYGLRLTTKTKAAEIEDSTSLRQFLRQAQIFGAWNTGGAQGGGGGVLGIPATQNPFEDGTGGADAGSAKPETGKPSASFGTEGAAGGASDSAPKR